MVYFYTVQHMEHMYLDQLELVDKNRKKNIKIYENQHLLKSACQMKVWMKRHETFNLTPWPFNVKLKQNIFCTLAQFMAY